MSKRKLIEPKPTIYGRVRFRSRLEARWAVLLDHVPNVLNWTYEPETFRLSNGWTYTPDFLIKFFLEDSFNEFHLEVKPDKVSTEYERVLGRFCKEKKLFLVIAEGSLWEGEKILLTAFTRDNERKGFDLLRAFTALDSAIASALDYRFDLKD